MNIGTTFSFTEKPDLGIYNEELSGVTVGKVYEVSRICVTGSALFIDDEGQENYAAGLDGMLKDYVQIHSLNKPEPYIHGYVVVHKETGERWGSCFDSQTGAKTSWYGTFCRRSGYPPSKLKHLVGKKFNEQEEFIIKPLIIWGQ